jgi:hypothetical protein
VLVFEPAGRPGPGREGFAVLAGVLVIWRALRNPARTLPAVPFLQELGPLPVQSLNGTSHVPLPP